MLPGCRGCRGPGQVRGPHLALSTRGGAEGASGAGGRGLSCFFGGLGMGEPGLEQGSAGTQDP